MPRGLIRTDEEVYTCDGCGGEVTFDEATWLPEGTIADVGQAQPYCSKECFEYVKRLAERSLRGASGEAKTKGGA